MNKFISIVVLAVLSSVAFAQSAPPLPQHREPKPLSPEQKAKRDAAIMKNVGGFVSRRNPGSSILIADARKEASDIGLIAEKMQTTLRIPVIAKAVRTANDVSPFMSAKLLLGDTKEFGAVAFLYDGKPDDPVLSVFPENRISLLNVTPCMATTDEDKRQDRLVKEIWRTVAYAAGGWSVDGTAPCVMRPVFTPEDIDELPARMFSPFVACSIRGAAAKFGFSVIQQASYLNACRQGWAPAPTNEFQKAILERVKAGQLPAPAAPTAPFIIRKQK